MIDTPKHDKLEILLHRIKRVELRLDSATEILEKFCMDNLGEDFVNDSTYLSHVEREKFASLEWTQSFDAVINHDPLNFEELKFKTLALFEYIKAGDADVQVLETIKRDLNAFKLESTTTGSFTELIDSNGNNQTFLLVDDNQIDRMLMKKALLRVRSDLKFIELEDGTNVVDVIKQNNPCITLLDVRMPGIDGYDVLKLIRNDSELSDHKVWMLSTSSEQQDINTAFETGASGYYSKPTSLAGYSTLASNIFESVAA